MSLENYITSHCFFKWDEVIVSKDYPEIAQRILLNDTDKNRVRFWVQSCGDPWRMRYPDYPMIILSGKRNKELNEKIGGAKDSDHLYANASDVYAKGMSAEDFFCSILSMKLPYRQLILYPKSKFVHWSINVPGRTWKEQIIIMKEDLNEFISSRNNHS